MPGFSGFPAETLRFLRELEKNNRRDWFEANRSRYEEVVRGPALDFIVAMAPEIEAISEHFTAIPTRAGGSLMRVNRDIRFSRDKSPYKTNVGIQFRHERARDVHAPGFYVHIDPAGCFLGAGAWHPEASALARIRERIVEKPNEWKKVRDGRAFRSIYTLGGESLKRPPRGFDQEHECIEDLKRKDFIATFDFAAREIHAPGFVRQVAGAFKKANAFMEFLCSAVEADF